MMILYTVFYRKLGTKRWSEIQNIKGDGFLENNQGRFFVLEDETQYHLPYSNVEYKFSKERYLSILERMNNESGQDININKR